MWIFFSILPFQGSGQERILVVNIFSFLISSSSNKKDCIIIFFNESAMTQADIMVQYIMRNQSIGKNNVMDHSMHIVNNR